MYSIPTAYCLQENKFVSCYDHITWNDKRLQGIATEDDKSETFVAQARTLLDTLEVTHSPSSCGSTLTSLEIEQIA